MCRSGIVCASFLGLAMVTEALGENRIREWSGHEPNDVDISQVYATVLIKNVGTYKLEALDVDPNDPNTVLGLGYFQEVSVDSNCPAGTVNLYIARDPNDGGGPGATDVYYLELLNAPNVTVNIAEMRVTATLPDLFATATTGAIVADDSIGNIGVTTLGGEIVSANLGVVYVTWLDGDITAGTIGDVYATWFGGNIIAESTLGDVWIDVGLTGSASITVAADYEGDMNFPGDLPALQIYGNASGEIYGTDASASVDIGWLTGTLIIGGDCDPDITLQLGCLSGDVWLSQPFAAALHIAGAVDGYASIEMTSGLDSAGSLAVDGTMAGSLEISGNLEGAAEFGYTASGASFHGGGDLSGSISFADSLYGVLTIDGDVTADGLVSVAADLGQVTAPVHWGEIAIGGTVYGTVEVGGDAVFGRMTVGPIAEGGTFHVGGNIGEISVEIQGDIAGTLDVVNDCHGPISVWGTVQDDGLLSIGQDADMFFTWPPDGIRIGGSVEGALSVGSDLRSYLNVAGDVALGGQVITGGSAYAPYPEIPSVPSVQVDGWVWGTLSTGANLAGEWSMQGVGPGASVEVGGDLAEDQALQVVHEVYGTVAVDGTLEGNVVADYVPVGGTIAADTIGQSGAVVCANGADGAIVVDKNMLGVINVGGPTSGERSPTTTGRIEVGGDVAAGGQIIAGELSDPYDPNDPNSPPPLSAGYIIVNGELKAGPDDLVASITLHWGLAGDTEFIAIGYGGGPSSFWDPNCPITLEHGDDPDEVFYGNTPSRHIWEVSVCHGDFNNDQSVGYGDLNPYIVARNSPADYAAWFPGLGGTYASNYPGASRLWHGDTNCDST
jgi:hypothetical protein